jgi:Leucine-rich repeat (LRR) protein
LEKLVFLEELDLSYNLIQKIENLDQLIRLKDLNLAENSIKKIEGLVKFYDLPAIYYSGKLEKPRKIEFERQRIN